MAPELANESFLDLPLIARLRSITEVFRNAVQTGNHPHIRDCLITIGEVAGRPNRPAPRNQLPGDVERASAAIKMIQDAAMIDEDPLYYMYYNLRQTEMEMSYTDGSSGMAAEAEARDMADNLAAGALYFDIDLEARRQAAQIAHSGD